MTCKECLHCDVCSQESLATDISPYIDYSGRNDVEKECGEFIYKTMNANKILDRFQKNLDYQISQQTNPTLLMFFMQHYGEEYFKDEDAVETRGYYKGLKVAREMLQRIIAEEEEIVEN